MNEEQLEKLIDQYFEAYPEEKILLITSDGQVFLLGNKSDAQNHQSALNRQSGDSSKDVLEIYRKQWENIASGEIMEEEGDDSNHDTDHEEEKHEDIFPDESCTKAVIAEFLQSKGVVLEGNETKAVLLEKVNELKNA